MGDQRSALTDGSKTRDEPAISVLCVDDEPDVVDLTGAFLERESDRIRTRTVTNVPDALERLDAEPIDCVVSDYQMPGTDGLAFLDIVRDDYDDLPFVLFTGKGSEEIASEAISRGVTDYLQKGLGTDQYTVLANRVENAVVRHRAESRFESFLNSAPYGIVISDAEGHIHQVNEHLSAQFGYERDQLLGEPIEVLLPERYRDEHVRHRERYVESPERRPMGADFDLWGRRTDGTEFPVEITLSPIDLDSDLEVVASVHDVTARREREAEVADLNRLNQLRHETIRAATMADSRVAIEQAVCDTLAEADPYVFAWIGKHDPATDEVVPTASAGIGDGYLDEISITVRDEPSGRGPAATAVRTGTIQTLQNIREDSESEPWRRQALDRGYESCAAVPIANDEAQYGILNLYADRPDAFDETERRLLTELAAAITSAIAEAETRLELRDRKRMYERLTERISDAYYAVDSAWQITYWNEEMAARTNTPVAAVEGKRLWDAFPELRGTDTERRYREAMAAQEPCSFETFLDEPYEYWVEVDVYPDEDGLSIFFREITERKEREEKFELAETLFENTQDVLFVIDVDEAEDEYYMERVNPAHETQAGLSNGDVRGQEIRDIFGSEEGSKVLENYRRCVGERAPLHYEERLPIPEAGTYWETQLAPVVIDGTVEKLVGATRNITDRKERENEFELAETLFENTQDALFIIDVDEDADEFRLERVSPAYEAHSGLSNDEIRGRTLRDVFGDVEGKAILSNYRECVAKREPLEYEEQLSVPEEGTYWETRIAPVVIDGRVEQLVGATRNVTERKMRERKYDAIFNQTYQFTGLMDPDGTMVEANESALEFGGLAREDVVGKPVWESGWFPDDAETKEMVRCLVDRASSGEFIRTELDVLGADGVVTVDYSIKPITDETGKVVLLLPEARDITELKEREEELEQKREFLAQIQEVADIGGWEYDGRTDTVRWTDELYRIHGVPLDYEPTVEKGLDFYHPEDRATISEAFERVATVGEPYDLKLRLITNDDEMRWVRSRGEPWYDDGELVGVRGAFRDVTERTEREQELERQNERLDEFAAVVSHDLRNPLTVAQGSLELGRQSGTSEDFDRIEGAHERMNSLINDLLSLARQGQLVEEAQPVVLDRVVRAAWETVRNGPATLDVAIDDHRIEADESRLRQLFENLLSNAVRHGGDDVSIRVGLLDDRDGFYVEDDGPGISPAEREDVFEHGYSTTREGTGFGLAIVEEIAEAHGWTVAATEGTDGGARFEVTVEPTKQPPDAG